MRPAAFFELIRHVSSQLRNSLIVGFGIVIAIVAGWEIANESFALAGVLGGALLLWLASRALAVPADALLAGLVLAGYLIGNRGFAQVSVPRLPLLPGELALGLGLIAAGWATVRSKELPVRRDALNFVLLGWLALGAIRLWVDTRAHGFVAFRDSAIVYYALFFFLAQKWWDDPRKRAWIEGCLTVGFVLGAPVFLAFARWPEFFLNHFSLRGMPLIYVKSDVQAGLLLAGTFWFLHRYLLARHFRWLLLAAMNLFGVAMANSRAALVALAATCIWLLLCRNWRLFRPLTALLSIGVFALLVTPFFNQSPWKQSLGYRFYESANSILDFKGIRSYETVDLGDKPDNNRFRLTWWRTVVQETWAVSPWLGLGFGYDLSDKFTREYYAEGSEEFSARSPHNFPLTVFGRMGFIGAGLLFACLAGMATRTWRTGRFAAQNPTANASFTLWVGAWGIFVCACFGVVLEGPMGAVMFWTLLGMANASMTGAPVPDETDLAAEATLTLARPVDQRPPASRPLTSP